MSAAGVCKFPATALAAAVAATAVISLAAAFFSASFYSRRARFLYFRVQELEASFKASVEKAASERRGRVRAQQALREALIRQSSNDPMISASVSASSYPMAPIGFVQSCFATRNGTPRQPLLVPLSRACLVFDPSRVPPDALDGLAEYSYCWVLYIFHLNTDLEKLWRQPSLSKFKAKVRVPRLEGGKMGVLATRSPHRPCPIGLSVAKIEALEGHAVLLSGVDMVDGTPVLDIKPYLPYSDSIEGANVPSWLKEENALAVSSVYFSAGFRSTLSICWSKNENISLYSSIDEFESLIKQVLSWDIRSLSQRSLPHNRDPTLLSVGIVDEDSSSSNDIIYHVILEEVDISYRIDGKSNVIVEKATLVSNACKFSKGHHNYSMWRNRFDNQK